MNELIMAGLSSKAAVELLAGFAGALGGLLGMLMAYLKGHSTGREVERTRQAQEQLDAVKAKGHSDETVDSLTPGERRERLRGWSAS